MTASGQAEAHPGAIPIDGWEELTGDYVELARFWVSSRRSFVLVSPDAAKTPALLGSLLGECIRTAAETYASDGSMSASEALAELWRGLDEERARLANHQNEEERD